MEKNIATIKMGFIGTAIRINSFIPSLPKVSYHVAVVSPAFCSLALLWVAVKELELHYYSGETFYDCYIYPLW